VLQLYRCEGPNDAERFVLKTGAGECNGTSVIHLRMEAHGISEEE
jgi:hypothetical protein